MDILPWIRAKQKKKKKKEKKIICVKDILGKKKMKDNGKNMEVNWGDTQTHTQTDRHRDY